MISARNLADWFIRGCPGKVDGVYDVAAVYQWAVDNGKLSLPTQRRPDDSRRSGKNWHDERAKEQALKLKYERREMQRRLVPSELISQMFAAFAGEFAAQLDQLEVDVTRLVPAGKCDRSKLKVTVRKRCDSCRNSLADFLDEWARSLKQSTEQSAASPDISDQYSGSDMKTGSRKTSTSRRKSARTPDTTDLTTDSPSGAARAKRSRTKKLKQ